jgi:DNA-binding transcriptional ArsR family regulator
VTSDQASTGRKPPEHVHPREVPIGIALAALADPIRMAIVRELAAAPDWTVPCGAFDLAVGKATRSHHFNVLREAGLLEQRDQGARRINRLRRAEFDAVFPGLLDLVLTADH